MHTILETTNLDNYNSGSHEIFLRYEIFKTIKKLQPDSSKVIIMKKLYSPLPNDGNCFTFNCYSQSPVASADKKV
jgi:hypothetical protein